MGKDFGRSVRGGSLHHEPDQNIGKNQKGRGEEEDQKPRGNLIPDVRPSLFVRPSELLEKGHRVVREIAEKTTDRRNRPLEKADDILRKVTEKAPDRREHAGKKAGNLMPKIHEKGLFCS